MQTMSLVEAGDLVRLETVIETGFGAFVAVGQALTEIQCRRLYRDSHRTWEDYCADRWAISGRHARRLIDAADVAEDLKRGPVGHVLPESERVVRPLVPLEPDERRAAWQEATRTAGGQPTAAQVQAVSLRALAGLSAEEQRDVLADHGRQVREAAAPLERPDERTRRIKRVLAALEKARRAALGLGGEGEVVTDRIDAAVKAACDLG